MQTAILTLLLCCTLLTGCSTTPSTPVGGETDPTTAASSGSTSASSGGGAPVTSGGASGSVTSSALAEGSTTICCRVVEEDDGVLLLSALDSADVYTLSLSRSTPVTFQDPQEDDIEDGMLIDVTYSGVFAETLAKTFPFQLDGAAGINVTGVNVLSDGYDNLCELYLDILDDLWDEDPALRNDIQYVGLDLSQTRLSAGEQKAVIWAFAQEVHKEPLTGTWEELADQGYINRDDLYWENGVFFSIVEDNSNYKEGQITFDAQMWRSGTGAYFYNDCTARQDKDGEWDDYTVGSFAIS